MTYPENVAKKTRFLGITGQGGDRPWLVLRPAKALTGQWVAHFYFGQCAGAFRRYIPRREWETFKAEVQEEGAGRKVAGGNDSAGNGARGVQDAKGVS